MQWERLQLKHQPLIYEALEACAINLSDYPFTNLWMWNQKRNYHIALENSQIYLQFHQEKTLTFLAPIGPLSLTESLERLQKASAPLQVRAIPEEMLEALELAFTYEMHQEMERSDYIYDFQDLLQLSGNRYQTKRNWIYRFEEQYEFSHEPLSPEFLTKTILMEEKWIKEHPNAQAEHEAALVALKNFELLPLMGHVILIDQEVIAYTIGEYFKDSLIIHVEKALKEYPGAYPTINQLFLKSIKPATFINREEALGIPTLTQVKESYHPVKKLAKYLLTS